MFLYKILVIMFLHLMLLIEDSYCLNFRFLYCFRLAHSYHLVIELLMYLPMVSYLVLMC